MTKLIKKLLPKNRPISIQGEIGSYSHIAANALKGILRRAQDDNLYFRKNFDEVFNDINSGDVKFAVIPIENSTYGSIYQNYDNITKNNCEIIGEVYLKINFHLIVNPGTEFKDIKKIYTHPVGLGQIKKFLKENPQIEAIEFEDTAGSVKMIKEQGMMNAAAAASNFAAEVYGMEVLKENIHENPKNYTRFYLIEKHDDHINGKGATKTTIQFKLGEEAGSLYKTLRSFADRDIALSKIESRPIIGTEWEYIFYLDIEAGITEEKLQNALKELQDYVKVMKVLGSYKKGEYVNT